MRSTSRARYGRPLLATALLSLAALAVGCVAVLGSGTDWNL